MARMLGKVVLGYDYALGDDRDTRTARLRERREFRHETDGWRYRTTERLDPLDDPSDCQHGCNGECDRWGSDVCTWLCHPPDLATRAVQWAERYGHCDPDGEPDWSLVRAWLERWDAMSR